jgi:hypothetical protein
VSPCATNFITRRRFQGRGEFTRLALGRKSMTWSFEVRDEGDFKAAQKNFSFSFLLKIDMRSDYLQWRS